MKLFCQLCALFLLTAHALADTTYTTPIGPTNNPTFQQANKLYKAQKFAEAAKLFAQVLTQNTNDSGTVWRLAYCYYSVSNYESAAQELEKYVKLKPKWPAGHRKLGVVLTDLGKFDEAERAIREAIRLDPKNPWGYQYLGYCLKSQHRYDEAAPAFEQAIKIGGSNLGYCYLKAGESYAQTKKYRTAIPLLERAVALNTNDVYAYDWLGDSYYNTKNFKKAIATFTADLKIKPDRAYPLEWLGNSYCYQKNYKAGCDAFAKASKLEPDNVELQRAYAASLLDCGRATDAIKTLEPFQTSISTNKSLRVTFFQAYLMHRDYRKAAKLYPVIFAISAALLAIAFLGGSAALLRKSFRLSNAEHPHLTFAISWILLFFEAQIALVFFAGLFTSDKLVAGLLFAPVPLLVAAFAGFPRQPWGKPFLPPATLGWRKIVFAIGAWIGIAFISGMFMLVVKQLTHSEPEPRNVRVVLEIVREHRALAALVVVFLGPVAEEILFRGLLFGALQKWFRPMWTVIITAAIFAMIHVDPYYFFPLFLLGLLLGWARHTSNSIWFSTAIHIFQNALAFSALSLK